MRSSSFGPGGGFALQVGWLASGAGHVGAHLESARAAIVADRSQRSEAPA